MIRAMLRRHFERQRQEAKDVALGAMIWKDYINGVERPMAEVEAEFETKAVEARQRRRLRPQ